jgi:hypothetical protein
MQFSLWTLLALPVALVAAQTQKQACACVNSAGVTRVSGICQYQRGGITSIDGQEFVSAQCPSRAICCLTVMV